MTWRFGFFGSIPQSYIHPILHDGAVMLPRCSGVPLLPKFSILVVMPYHVRLKVVGNCK